MPESRRIAVRQNVEPGPIGIRIDLAELVVRHGLGEARPPVGITLLIAVGRRGGHAPGKLGLSEPAAAVENLLPAEFRRQGPGHSAERECNGTGGEKSAARNQVHVFISFKERATGGASALGGCRSQRPWSSSLNGVLPPILRSGAAELIGENKH